MEALIVPGTMDSLSIIRRYVQDAADAANLDQKTAYRLFLAVDEIATNIVAYGYDIAGIAGDIEVRATINDDALIILLKDTAPPFDPTLQQEPDDLAAPLEERKIGGLGIYLALNGVDNFMYEYIDNHNCNTFVVYRTAQS